MGESTQERAREDARQGRKPDPNLSGKEKKRYDAAFNDEKEKQQNG